MGRIYTATASATSTTAGDIISLEAPSDSILALHSLEISQSTSETDDSTLIDISRWATAGSGGSAITPSPVNVGAAASGATVRAFDTTDASSTQTILWQKGMSTLAGIDKVWTPETRIYVPASGRIVVKFVGDVTSITMVVTIAFEEID